MTASLDLRQLNDTGFIRLFMSINLVESRITATASIRCVMGLV